MCVYVFSLITPPPTHHFFGFVYCRFGGQLVGLDFRFKGADSLAQKIGRDVHEVSIKAWCICGLLCMCANFHGSRPYLICLFFTPTPTTPTQRHSPTPKAPHPLSWGHCTC